MPPRRFVNTLLLILCAAPGLQARAAEEDARPQIDPTALRVSTKITLRNGDGAVVSSVERKQDIAFEDVPATSGAGRIVRLMISDGATPAGGPKGVLRLLALDGNGRLTEPFELEDGVEIRPEDMGTAEVLSSDAPTGVATLRLRWPLPEGRTMPVILDIEPGRCGGEGKTAWREIRFRCQGELPQNGREVLRLEGSGRMVLAQDKGELLALDLGLCSKLLAAGRPRAVAEAEIHVRPAAMDIGEVPEWGCIAPQSTPARRPLAPLLGCVWLLALVGGLTQGRRRRQQVLSVLLAISLGLGAWPALADQAQDIEASAISNASGALAGMGSVFRGLKALGLSDHFAFALSDNLLGYMIDLEVVGVMLIIHGAKSIYRDLAMNKAKQGILKGSIADRIEAIRLLGAHDKQGALYDLFQVAAYDPVPEVRAAAVEAIGALKGTRLPDTLRHLADKDDSPLVKRAVDKVLDSWQAKGIIDRLQGATK